MRKEIRLNGIPIVAGWGVGKAYFVGRAVQQTPSVTISRQDVGDEIMRFNEIREKARNDYRKHISEMKGNAKLDTSILNIYEHIIDDPAFIGQVVETITTKLYDLETSIRTVSNEFIKRFDSSGTAYFKERSGDMVEVCEKLISFLYEDDGRTKTFLEPVVLIVLRTFTPTDILSYDKSKIQAVVTSSGGKTSHAAILARSYSIPVVSGIPNLSEYIRPGDEVLVDADKGHVFVRPMPNIKSRYKRLSSETEIFRKLINKWRRPVYTRDGIQIEVLANISLPEDVDDALQHGADGIGLVRTEYLISNRKEIPPEEVQYQYYKTILEKADKKPCVIRLMDIGGDKVPKFFNMPLEFNPFMGWRAIRIFLDRKDLFETQLKAIMRAGEKHDYAIMVPMVTTLKEFLDAKAFIESTAAKLSMKRPKCGVLFEVPLAILEMETFMKEIDFASIGTNDLIQYLSAADRNNARVNYLYNPIEPAFIRIIRNAIKCANDNGMPLSICGEMAGNWMHTILLIGLGLRKFSVIPRNIPILKELIANISSAEAAESISHIDAIVSTTDLAQWLKNLNKRLLGSVLEKLPIEVDV